LWISAALGGALTDGNGATNNISAAQVRLDADAGIGAADAIESTGAGLLFAAQTRTGNLQIVNTGAMLVGTVGGLAGVQITSGVAAGNIVLRTRSPLTINSDVINNSGGNIILAAEGNLVSDDLAINANITATGGDGNISLYAGDSVLQRLPQFPPSEMAQSWSAAAPTTTPAHRGMVTMPRPVLMAAST
jgi:hypothetical protein